MITLLIVLLVMDGMPFEWYQIQKTKGIVDSNDLLKYMYGKFMRNILTDGQTFCCMVEAKCSLVHPVAKTPFFHF